MPQVRIALKLEDRSGILAALIARLSRHDLTFHTHRAEETASGRAIEIDAEGIVDDTEELIHGLSAVRGVEDVTDIVVDGTSLLKAPEPTEVEAGDPETVTAETLRGLAAGAVRRGEGGHAAPAPVVPDSDGKDIPAAEVDEQPAPRVNGGAERGESSDARMRRRRRRR